MKPSRISLFVFPLLLIALLPTGCWNRRELKDLGIVGAIFIDEKEDQVQVTFEVVKPLSSNKIEVSHENSTYVQSVGKSSFDAGRNAALKFDKKLFFPHANVYLFSEQVSQKGLLQFLDFYNRDHERRHYVHIAVMKNGNAQDVIGLGAEMENTSSNSIESKFDNNSAHSKAASIKLLEFLQDYFEEGIEPICGVVEKVKKTQMGENEQVNKYELNVEGTAVFLEDQLVGFLDGDETRGLNFIRNNVKSGLISILMEDHRQLSMEILTASSKKEVILTNESVTGKVKLLVTGMISEVASEDYIESLAAAKNIEKKLEDEIKSELEKTIHKAQQYKSDILGFGQVLHRKQPAVWKQVKGSWNKLFSNMNTDIEVNVEIQRYGVSNRQLAKKAN